MQSRVIQKTRIEAIDVDHYELMSGQRENGGEPKNCQKIAQTMFSLNFGTLRAGLVFA